MPQYQYQGINGTGKSIKGVITADNIGAAKTNLRRDNIFPSQIFEVTVQTLDQSHGRLGFLGRVMARVPLEARANATRQLATLVGAHVPLVDALQALTDQIENPKLRAAYAKVRSDVNEGVAFHKALSRFPDFFSDLYVNMVGAGETSGTLEIVLSRLADFLEYSQRLQSKVKNALLYPILMLVAGLVAVLIIFTTVIPKIADIFTESKQTLPLITQVVLMLSNLLVSYWWVLVLVLVVGIETLRRYLRSPTGKRQWDEWSLRLPIMGELIRMIEVSRFTKTLSTLLKSGIPLLTSLSVVKSVVSNTTIQRAIEQATLDLTEGANISDPLKRSRQFPPLVTHMIAVGEKTGELELMLEKVSEHYEFQVNTRVQAFTALIEPLMIFFMAGMVALIVLSVILPMLQINNSAL